MDPIIIGNFINKERKRLSLTQSELADKLMVTSQAISKWENGRGIPDIEMLKKLSEIFNVDINEILNGKKEKKKKRAYIIISAILGVILLFLSFYLLLMPKDSFRFSTLATENDLFMIKGAIAFNKNKKSIYISEVKYEGKDESLYKNIECILYESLDNVEKLVSKWGNLDPKEERVYPLTELLSDLEFSVDNYECKCTNLNCNNLYLKINALDKDNKVITYNIPLEIDSTCTK